MGSLLFCFKWHRIYFVVLIKYFNFLILYLFFFTLIFFLSKHIICNIDTKLKQIIFITNLITPQQCGTAFRILFFSTIFYIPQHCGRLFAFILIDVVFTFCLGKCGHEQKSFSSFLVSLLSKQNKQFEVG